MFSQCFFLLFLLLYLDLHIFQCPYVRVRVGLELEFSLLSYQNRSHTVLVWTRYKDTWFLDILRKYKGVRGGNSCDIFKHVYTNFLEPESICEREWVRSPAISYQRRIKHIAHKLLIQLIFVALWEGSNFESGCSPFTRTLCFKQNKINVAYICKFKGKYMSVIYHMYRYCLCIWHRCLYVCLNFFTDSSTADKSVS